MKSWPSETRGEKNPLQDTRKICVGSHFLQLIELTPIPEYPNTCIAVNTLT